MDASWTRLGDKTMTKLLFLGDPGIDDAVAILCAARWYELVGVVATHGNAPP